MKYAGKGIALAFIAILIGSAGCQQLFIGRAVSEVRGGSGYLVVIRDPAPTALLKYRYAMMENVRNEMGPALPYYAVSEVQRAFGKVLTRKQLYRFKTGPARSTLVIRTSIVHYQSSSGLSKLLGGFNQLVCRVELIDGGTRRIVGQANCVGISKALARSGIEELSEGCADALRKWLTTGSHEEG